MAKHKLKLKIKKQTWRRLRRDPRLHAAILSIMLVLGFGGGVFAVHVQPGDQHPQNIVWAADTSVSIPPDLVSFLEGRDNCQSYRGTGSPAGVGIWAVYQVSHARFAKISYGCSTTLTSYIMAAKVDGQWQLLSPQLYFSTAGFLPKCPQIEKYQIDKSIEPYCIKDDGAARSNTVE